MLGVSTRRKLLLLVLLLVLVVAAGTIGYHELEQWPLLDALYMTVITISTVGFSEIRPLTNEGRSFTMILIFLGGGTAAYGIGSLIEYVLSSELSVTLAERRRQRLIDSMQNHYIICGFGRLGRQIASEFSSMGVAFVVIDEDTEITAECARQGYACVQGDATKDAVLLQAGVNRAKGLLTALDSDAENLYVVLSARHLQPDLLILARADQEESESKLLQAGANRVLSPYALGGRRMAAMALRPNVVQFLDVVTHAEDLELWLEEVSIGEDSPLSGMSLGETRVRSQTGALVLAVVGPDGRLVTNPESDFALASGSRVIALGTRTQLRALCDLAATGKCTLNL